jgi:hypothetical protein
MNLRLGPKYSLATGMIFIIALVFASACSGGSDDSAPGGGAYDSASSGYGITEEQSVRLERGDSASEVGGSSAPSPFATAAPAVSLSRNSSQPAAESGDTFGLKVETASETVFGVAGAAGAPGSPRASGVTNSGGGSASIEQEIASATDGRIIIRTADMNVTVEDVTMTLDDISKIAVSSGGWVVTSNQPRNYSGSISIRVPADRFDDVIEQLSDLAVKVKSVSTRSEDFTEEFTDVTARSLTLKDTLEALRVLYDRAFSVEDAITIQKEITNVQSDLESLEARLNFLSQSSAFSFISVDLASVPFELVIDAGDDIAAAVGHAVTYRAKFTPPEGIEDFNIRWNFGDGSHEVTTNRIAPTGNGDEVITSPVIHVFDRDEDSPFIVTAELEGFGDSGLAEGEDTLVTTVSRLPVIEVFAGENQVVESGSRVEFLASFTRPEGVTGITYTWNFGDGSAPVEPDLSSSEEGGQIKISHTYANFRPNPYVAILTVTGQTEVGEVEATDEVLVFVQETIGVAAADLDAGSTTRDAVRTLQSVGVFLAKAGLWLLILSPAWLIGGGLLFVVMKRRNAIRIPRRGSK